MGRPSKEASRKRKNRADESVEAREERLEKNYKRIAEKRSNEDTNERKSRLSEIRERARTKLKRESSVKREQRLNVIRARLQNETKEKRERRINVIRARLQNETKEKRERRINVIRARLRNETKEKRERRISIIRARLQNESNVQREHRLQLIRVRSLMESNEKREHRLRLQRNRLQNELSEKYYERLTNMIARRRKIFENENTENRQFRLKQRSEKIKKQRRERILQEENFKATINIFSDVPCSICYKALYPQQRCTLQTSVVSSIIPVSLMESEKVIACSRCFNSLKKRKVPPQAFWNKMKITDIPEVISNLTEIERQMLCRIVPFMKIIKVHNRFSQNWCKGQVVLFARDVIEVAEQLPLNVNETGMIIVTENLQNIDCHRQFQIDIERIRTALEWLIENNCLYKDVRAVYTNITNDISQIVNVNEERAVNRPVNDGKILVEKRNVKRKNEFVNLNENVSILRGSFHQGSDQFSVDTRGRQCTAIATVACVAFCLLHPSTWCTGDIDYIVLLGDKYYRECIETRRNPDPQEINADYLAVTELVPKLVYNDRIVFINVLCNDTLNGHIDNDNAEDGFPNLRNGLETFFTTYTYGILTINSTSVAVSRQNESNGISYLMFDSHARGPKGCKAPIKGVACCMQFNNINNLFAMLHRNLYAKTGNSNYMNVYSLTPLILTFDNNISSNGMEEHHVADMNSNRHANEGEIVFSTNMLRSIDEGVPNIDSVVTITNNNINDINNNAIKLVDIKRKTAPPLNLDRERRMEELAWFFLFPDGRNGFGEARDVPITPLDYYQARIMSSDRRFQRVDYLFFALSVVEYFRTKACISVSCRMRQGERTPSGLVDNIHLIMRNIRGTASYWRRCCSELIAMVRSLGAPTWFATFSCNDLNWSDMLKALLLADGRSSMESESLPFIERMQLVERYPVVIARQFTVRVNALMQYLKNSECLGGKVIDFWYRIEFQNRGSPHLHMLVWCANVPDFLTNSGRDVIEKVVSCSLDVPDIPLKSVIEKVQIHKHSSTCYKERNNLICRFGFPRPISEKTVCLGPNDTLANNGRFCILQRTSNEVMVNNYNPTLLKLWEGNMDIQPCGNVTAVAYYIAKYASKCEPQTTGNVIKEAISHAKRRGGTVWNQLFSVSMAILSQRLVSATECAYRLCHLPLKMSSRKAVFVNSCRPEHRYRILRFEGDETMIFNNIFDRYIQRPDNLENLSLAEFAVRYETVSSTMWDEDEGDVELRNDADDEKPKFIKLKDNTRMRIRSKPAVLRHRYYTLNSDREGYFYNLIVCHIPFRNENELTLENESAEECFIRRQHELKPLLRNTSAEQFAHAEQVIQAALAQTVALNAAREDATEQIFSGEIPVIHADEEVVNCYNDVIEDQQEQEIGAMPEDVFLKYVRGLNIQQKDLFKKVSMTIEKDIKNESTEQMLLFITGGAGSGKSFVLKLLVELIKRSYNPTVDAILKPNFVEVASLTGVAARQIFGKTLHSIFSLPIEKGSAMTYRKMTGQRLEQERRKWRYIKWLIIDEISMVSYENLRVIHLRLQEFKNNEMLFGNINVLLLGDIMQLPPVKGHWCYMQPTWCAAEINLWHQFSFCELTINMRQKDDIEFIDLLNSLRYGEITAMQLQILYERRRIPLSGEFDDGAAVRIFPTLKLVDEYNCKMTEAIIRKTSRVYIINAVDESREAATYGKKPPEHVIPRNANNCGGLLHTIQLGEGSRVMLRRNISISDGLVNGAMGIVKKFNWPALRRDQIEEGELPASVLIQFDDETIAIRNKDSDGYVAITPVTATYQATKGYGDIERRMLPLILSWAVTVHKLQGTTLNKAVIDLGKKNFAKGQIYVALSRVKNLHGIALSDIAPSKILNKPHDERSLAEMQRLRSLCFTNRNDLEDIRNMIEKLSFQ